MSASAKELTDHIKKRREDRLAKEKARIEKLRELNLKKYGKNDFTPAQPTPRKTGSISTIFKPDLQRNSSNDLPKNNTSGTLRRATTAPTGDSKKPLLAKRDISTANNKLELKKSPVNGQFKRPVTTDKKTDLNKKDKKPIKINKATETISSDLIDKPANNETKKKLKIEINIPRAMVSKHAKGDSVVNNNNKTINKTESNVRKSIAPTKVDPPKINKPKPENDLPKLANKPKSAENSRKSMIPTSNNVTKNNPTNPKRQSVFERLYQPKPQPKKQVTDSEKIKNDAGFFKKIIKNTGLILNKRQTCFEKKKELVQKPVRRSISAVHFRRISKSELANCVHKWSSIGDNLDRSHLKDITEDALVREDKIVSAVKSERKKVKFQTPVPFNYNTPKPQELQERLQNWLKKRGKSLDSFHHLQCFGIHHLAQKEIKPIPISKDLAVDEFDDEDKENQPVESDSDDDSYHENMNNKDELDVVTDNKWRRASNITCSDSLNKTVDFNDTQNTTLTSAETHHHVDELLMGALNDLTELLREGFDWEQSARWLRAVRERFPLAPETAAYWECRAALEERRGDLPASVQCWEEAIAKGTEHSVVEANLDQLLDKFMQLNISPSGGKKQRPDPKMVDMKNVFKSTLIRFAVQQAKLRQSQETPKFIVTPVRRSARLSGHWSGRRPLQLCATVRAAGELVQPLLFVPNDTLRGSP